MCILRKDKLKKIMAFFLLLTIIVPPRIQADAKKSKDYWPKLSDEITASAAILVDIDTGTILYKKNINEPYYPASITKILTTLIAVENSTMDEIVTFSKDAVYKTAGGSSIWRDIGEKMTMEQCLYAVMLESANECAYAVAEHIAGSVEDFAKMMNDKAKELGCTSSQFKNPHGLPDEDHYVTAKDMAIIARAAYENETFRLICGTKKYTIPPTNKHEDPTYMVNHHKMLYPKDTAAYLYDYCIGGKTGYTVAAGSTLVTYAQKDGMTLVSVLLNAHSPEYWNETRALLDFGFENFNLCNVAEYVETEENSISEKYDTLNTNEPYAQIDPQAKIILPKTVNFSKADSEIIYDGIPENALAQLKYTYGKHEIGTADIIRTNTVIDKNMSDIDARANTDTGSDPNVDSTGNEEKSDNWPKTFSGFVEMVGNKISGLIEKVKNINGAFSYTVLAIAAAALFVILIILLIGRFIFNNSYVIRQKIANYKNRKRASKQYVIIQDTRKSRRRGWRKRR